MVEGSFALSHTTDNTTYIYLEGQYSGERQICPPLPKDNATCCVSDTIQPVKADESSHQTILIATHATRLCIAKACKLVGKP